MRVPTIYFHFFHLCTFKYFIYNKECKPLSESRICFVIRSYGELYKLPRNTKVSGSAETNRFRTFIGNHVFSKPEASFLNPVAALKVNSTGSVPCTGTRRFVFLMN